jgi:hypothetical protein
MAQVRADGASIPFEIADGHWWTHGVVLPALACPSPYGLIPIQNLLSSGAFGGAEFLE